MRATFTVDAPPPAVHAHLVEPSNYIGLSPLVVEVRDVSPDRTRYVAVERFTLGPLKWDNLIRVTIDGSDGRVVSDVVSPGGVRLRATVELTPAGAGTTVTETIEIRAPWLLRGLARSQAGKVQQYRAAELTRRMRA